MHRTTVGVFENEACPQLAILIVVLNHPTWWGSLFEIQQLNLAMEHHPFNDRWLSHMFPLNNWDFPLSCKLSNGLKWLIVGQNMSKPWCPCERSTKIYGCSSQKRMVQQALTHPQITIRDTAHRWPLGIQHVRGELWSDDGDRSRSAPPKGWLPQRQYILSGFPWYRASRLVSSNPI